MPSEDQRSTVTRKKEQSTSLGSVSGGGAGGDGRTRRRRCCRPRAGRSFWRRRRGRAACDPAQRLAGLIRQIWTHLVAEAAHACAQRVLHDLERVMPGRVSARHSEQHSAYRRPAHWPQTSGAACWRWSICWIMVVVVARERWEQRSHVWDEDETQRSGRQRQTPHSHIPPAWAARSSGSGGRTHAAMSWQRHCRPTCPSLHKHPWQTRPPRRRSSATSPVATISPTRSVRTARTRIRSGRLSGAPFLPATAPAHPRSFAVFICLQCAGVHRGFGVHIRRALSPSASRTAHAHQASSDRYRWTHGRTSRSAACSSAATAPLESSCARTPPTAATRTPPRPTPRTTAGPPRSTATRCAPFFTL